jgi:O-antigen ligase
LILFVLLLFHLGGWMLGVNICTVLLVIMSFFTPNVKLQFLNMVRNPFFFLAVTPFLLYALSLLYTADLTEGVRNVTTKLPLLLFPVIVGLWAPYREKDLLIVARTFLVCIACMGVIGFAFQYGQYLETGDTGFFYNDHLGSKFGKQAVYFAWFVNSALCILLLGWKVILPQKRQALTGALLFVLLTIIQILLASRTSLIIMMLLIAFCFFYRIAAELSRTRLLIVLSLMLASLTATTIVFPKVLNRFKSISSVTYRMDNPNPINHFNGTYSEENWDGLTARLAIWECARLSISRQVWTGCGVGDVPNELRKSYKEKHFILGQKEDFNTHNQFMDVWLATGSIGFLLFSASLFLLMLQAFRKSHVIFGLLLAIFILSMLTENILNRNQGVVMAALLLSGILVITGRGPYASRNLIESRAIFKTAV